MRIIDTTSPSHRSAIKIVQDDPTTKQASQNPAAKAYNAEARRAETIVLDRFGNVREAGLSIKKKR